MIEAIRILESRGSASVVCVAVHGLFSDDSDELLAKAGARVVTSNSVPHRTNHIDVAPILASAVVGFP